MRVLFFLALLVAASAHAQDEPSAALNPESVLHVSAQLVTLDALVENKKTHAVVGGLTRSDFQLAEDGVAQPLSYFDHDQLPLSIVFLFDITDSVRPTLKPLAAGAVQMLSHLKPTDEVAVMVFAKHARLLQDYTTDHALVTKAIEKAAETETGEPSWVYQAMGEAIDQAGRAQIPNSRRVLVWLTDGSSNLQPATEKDSESGTTLHTKQDDIDRLHRTGVTVAGLIEHSAAGDAILGIGFLGGARMGDIRHFAGLTGGPVLNTSRKEVADKLSDLIDDLRSRYTLGYRPTVPKPSGTLCTLTVKLSPEAYQKHPELPKDANLMISARQAYFR